MKHGCCMRCSRMILILAGFLGLGAIAVRAADHYVSTVGTNNFPYTNWPDAATNIQWAVNAAAGGDTVWVTNGSYCLTNQILITNNITVKSVNGWTNTLAYAGAANTTRCFYVANNGVLDGFTISNGLNIGSNDWDGGGAGAYICTSGMVQNCYFVNNICSNFGIYSGGGGAFIYEFGTVSNCTFYSNKFYSVNNSGGGGVRTHKGGTVLGCTVISNYCLNISGLVAAGIYVTYNFSLTGVEKSPSLVSNCFVAYNVGIGIQTLDGRGWGLVSESLTTRTEIVNCVISNNNHVGIFMSGGRVKDCVIKDNKSLGISCNGNYFNRIINCLVAANFGGIYALNTDLIIDNCIIRDNEGGQGGICVSGNGTARNPASSFIIRNCLISKNASNTGANPWGAGGILMTNTTYRLDPRSNGVFNCTIVGNSTIWSAAAPGGILAGGLSNSIVNCIVASNMSHSYTLKIYGNDITNWPSEGSNCYYNNCAYPMTNNGRFNAGQGNITVNPNFVNPDADNWGLANNSPCINAGLNLGWMIPGSVDLDGRGRIDGFSHIVDIGAYEFWPKGTLFTVR